MLVASGSVFQPFLAMAEGSAAGDRSERPTIALKEAYARGRARSYELLQGKARINAAELNVRRAWALLKPTWTASYGFTHVAPEPDFSLKQGTDPDLMISEEQVAFINELLDGAFGGLASADTSVVSTRVIWNILNGRAVPALRNAYDSVEVEEDRLEAQTRELLLAIARAYYSAAATQQARSSSLPRLRRGLVLKSSSPWVSLYMFSSGAWMAASVCSSSDIHVILFVVDSVQYTDYGTLTRLCWKNLFLSSLRFLRAGSERSEGSLDVRKCEHRDSSLRSE